MMNQWNTASYIGGTSNLGERLLQHKDKEIKSFTQKYNIKKLVYFETLDNPNNAIAREKQLKKWSRKKKMELVKKVNPELGDLSEDLEL